MENFNFCAVYGGMFIQDPRLFIWNSFENEFSINNKLSAKWNDFDYDFINVAFMLFIANFSGNTEKTLC